MPVGSEKATEYDPRIICATNHDLWKDIEQDKFREDLFTRLCGIEILMPPLRERPDDRPLREKASYQC
jgi:transcriptional regulator with GAF, ATPase, and Fis domain